MKHISCPDITILRFMIQSINVARQVDEIRKKHQAERKAIQEAKEKGKIVEEKELSTEEVLSGFYRDDKLTPVITLVIYYG